MQIHQTELELERIETPLSGVCIIRPKVYRDARGFFLGKLPSGQICRAWHSGTVCAGQSFEVDKGLRGLHYELHHRHAKLCRVVQGEVLDMAVDISRGSPIFGQWTSALLSAENMRKIYIPAGFAYGFLVLSESAEFLYKCSDFYHPEDEYGVAWNDPDLKIEWGSNFTPLSKRQRIPTAFQDS